MKYINSVNISIPVFQVDAKITYQTVRKPTVFEKSILQLCHKYNSDLGRYTIKQIAEELKSLPVFFEDALNYLINFKAITTNGGATLSDYKITNEGINFLNRNQLPSKNKAEEREFYYHPINRSLVKKSSLSPFKKIDTEIDTDIFFITVATVEGMISGNVRDKWDKPNTRIVEVISNLNNITLSDTVVISLNIDGNANLSISSSDDEFGRWIDDAGKEFVWDSFLSDRFKIPSQLEKEAAIDWGNISNVYPLDAIPSASITKNNLVIISNNVVSGIDFPNVCLTAEVSKPKLSSKVLTLPKSFFTLDDSLVNVFVNKQMESISSHIGIKNIFFGGQTRKVGLGFETKDNVLWKDIRQRLEASDDIDIILFSSLIDLSAAIQRLPNTDLSGCQSYFQRMKPLNSSIKPEMLQNKIKNINDINSFNQLCSFMPGYIIPLAKVANIIIKELITKALTEDVHTQQIEISSLINNLSKSYFAIQRTVGKEFFKLNNKVDINRFRPTKELLSLLKSWADNIENLQESIGYLNIDIELLEEKNKKITLINESISKFFAPIREDRKHTVIIDTNCLMHNIEVIKHIEKNDFLIIPNVVLDELDGLKKDTDTKINKPTEKSAQARKAIARINDITDSDHFEVEKPLLLSKSEVNLTNDKKILSVAAYYRLNDVILVTDDKNLRNLASSEGISSMSTLKYIDEIRRY